MTRLRKGKVSPVSRGRLSLKSLVVLGAIFLVLVGLFSYLVLPGLVESRLAASLQEGYGLSEKPEVQVSSSFPPELLLGRIDRVQVRIDELVREGILLRDLRMDLEDVNVPVTSLFFRGNLEPEIGTGTLRAEVPEASINEYLQENDLGLEGGEIDVGPQYIVYRSADAFFGLPGSVALDLQVSGPRSIEVIPREAMLGGFELPPFLTRSLAAGGRTLYLSELPLGVELTSVETSSEDNALVVRAER